MKYEIIYHPEGTPGRDILTPPGRERPGYPPSVGLKLTDAEAKVQYGAWAKLAWEHSERDVLLALARLAERLAADREEYRLGENMVPRLVE